MIDFNSMACRCSPWHVGVLALENKFLYVSSVAQVFVQNLILKVLLSITAEDVPRDFERHLKR